MGTSKQIYCRREGSFAQSIGCKPRILQSYNQRYAFEVPLPYTSGLPVSSAGYATRYENVGRYLNHGVDFQVNVDLLRGRDWGVSANINFNYNRDKVLELFEGANHGTSQADNWPTLWANPSPLFCPL